MWAAPGCTLAQERPLAQENRTNRLAPHSPGTDGLGRFEPLIQAGERLSFSNLVEAHVLRALRVEHKVEMSRSGKRSTTPNKPSGSSSLLLSRELLAAPGSVFLERYGQLVNLGHPGQLAVRQLLEAHLQRVEWDISGLPVRLFPATSEDLDAL